jgi:hypothetical protein
MNKVLSNPKIIQYSPIVTTFLLEGSTVGHIFRMWTTRTSEGQSLLSWLYVIIALFIWLNWYRVMTPTQKWAQRSTMLSICSCIFGLFSVIYFRYVT